MAIELTKALIHDFYLRVAQHRIEMLDPVGTTKRLRQEEELALFHRYMNGDLSEEEKALAAEAKAEAPGRLGPNTRKS